MAVHSNVKPLRHQPSFTFPILFYILFPFYFNFMVRSTLEERNMRALLPRTAARINQRSEPPTESYFLVLQHGRGGPHEDVRTWADQTRPDQTMAIIG